MIYPTSDFNPITTKGTSVHSTILHLKHNEDFCDVKIVRLLFYQIMTGAILTGADVVSVL